MALILTRVTYLHVIIIRTVIMSVAMEHVVLVIILIVLMIVPGRVVARETSNDRRVDETRVAGRRVAVRMKY